MNRRQLCLGTAALALSGSALPQTAATGDPAMPSALQNAINAAIKGSYPADILELVQKYQLDTGIEEGDAAKVGAAKPEFLGINYYVPLYIRTRKDAKTDYAPEMQLSDGDKEVAFNGAVRPDLFKELLLRIRDEWDNPTVIITENGAGFPGGDELKDGKVNDTRRRKYLANLIATLKEAMQAGAKVVSYHAWSSHDNLEWFSGYGSRFGMVYVDFKTQARTPKLSTAVYQQLFRKRSRANRLPTIPAVGGFYTASSAI